MNNTVYIYHAENLFTTLPDILKFPGTSGDLATQWRLLGCKCGHHDFKYEVSTLQDFKKNNVSLAPPCIRTCVSWYKLHRTFAITIKNHLRNNPDCYFSYADIYREKERPYTINNRLSQRYQVVDNLSKICSVVLKYSD